MSTQAPEILLKRAAEVLTYAMDFVNLLQADETISTVVAVTAATGLTVGSGTIVESQVQFACSGGTAGSVYLVTVRVTTSNGQTRESTGQVMVEG